jgi:tRNA G10  N-methylase Trm11
MPTQLFISGKNWKLSLAELSAYLQSRHVGFQVQFASKDFFVIQQTQNVNSIDDLGGTIKIGQNAIELPTELVKSAFLEKNKEAHNKIAEGLALSKFAEGLAQGKSGKPFFGVSVYCSENQLRPYSSNIQRFIGSAIKEELAGFGKKSDFMGFSKDRKLAQLSHVEVLKKNLVENKAEILFCIGKEKTWVAQTTAVHNPFEFQRRDVYKPRQRNIFGMPPRLARIMLNLAFCQQGKVLLDPFCGVGTVLQEALLLRSQVLGLDINPWCVSAAEENLDWIVREYSVENADFRVIQGDVASLTSKVGFETVDCIVTEPDLGPALRQVPTVPYAEKLIAKLEPLFYGFIREACNVLRKDGRLVLVTPFIRTRSGQMVTMNIEEKAKQAGFTLVQPFGAEVFGGIPYLQDSLAGLCSLVEIDERHKIGRQIHIFQK